MIVPVIIIGITGPIASGKSTADSLLSALGASPVIDADLLVHRLYTESAGLQLKIIDTFGVGVRNGDGSINRQALARLVFPDSLKLATLESIVHPFVRDRIHELLDGQTGVAVVDAVKLLQGPLSSLCTVRWWISVDSAIQMRRLVDLRGFTDEEARFRLAVQPKLDDWRSRVDHVFHNSGSLSEFEDQITNAWHGLIRSKNDSQLDFF